MYIFLSVLCLLTHELQAHSWMSCPLSFAPGAGRGGILNRLCENSGNGVHVTEVQAGDRLKVGWPSNNHAGGFVRISLVSFGEHVDENIVKNKVLKFACYGKDSNEPVKSPRGECNHPCNAREGCNYQSYDKDFERYDTTIGIPTNLEDGYYVLMLAMLVGNGLSPYFSCGKLHITGGNPDFNCQSNEPPILYDCFKSRAGRELKVSNLYEGAKRGNFCFFLNGTRGDVDSNIRDVPVNVECDPRITCSQSFQRGQCFKDAPTMSLIRNQQQPYCKVYNTLPPLSLNIYNGPLSSQSYGGYPAFMSHYYLAFMSCYDSLSQSGNIYNSSAVVHMSLRITRSITTNQCWQMIVQYTCPVTLNDTWKGVQVVNTKQSKNIVMFEQEQGPLKPLNPGQIIEAVFEITNPCFNNPDKECMECSNWNDELMQFNRFELDVKESSISEVSSLKSIYLVEQW